MSGDQVSRAEALIEHLRPESPLRHRLTGELDEIRKRCARRQRSEIT